MANLGLIQGLQYTRYPGRRKGAGPSAAAPPGAKANSALAPDPKSALFNPLPSVMPREGLGEGAVPGSPSLPVRSLGLCSLPAACYPAPAREQQIDEPEEERRCIFFSPPCFSHAGFKILLAETRSGVCYIFLTRDVKMLEPV